MAAGQLQLAVANERLPTTGPVGVAFAQ